MKDWPFHLSVRLWQLRLCEVLMLPTNFSPSISKVVSQLWNCLVTSCVTVNVSGIIAIHVFIGSSGWKLKTSAQLVYYQNLSFQKQYIVVFLFYGIKKKLPSVMHENLLLWMWTVNCLLCRTHHDKSLHFTVMSPEIWDRKLSLSSQYSKVSLLTSYDSRVGPHIILYSGGYHTKHKSFQIHCHVSEISQVWKNEAEGAE